MAENAADLDAEQVASGTGSSTDNANSRETAQEKLEAAYDKIMDKISDGYYDGNNVSLIDECGVRDVFGENQKVIIDLIAPENVNPYASGYTDKLGDNWDGSALLNVELEGGRFNNGAVVPAQGLYDFVHDASRDEQLSRKTEDGKYEIEHSANPHDGITDAYVTKFETADGHTAAIDTVLIPTLHGDCWESLAFTDAEEDDDYERECDISEDPIVLHESVVEYMQQEYGEAVDVKEDSNDSADTNDDRVSVEKLEDVESKIIDEISSVVNDSIGGLIEELKGDISDDDDKMDAKAENDEQDKVSQKDDGNKSTLDTQDELAVDTDENEDDEDENQDDFENDDDDCGYDSVD